MKVLKTVSLAVLSLLSPILGCDKILGIEEKQYDAGGSGGQGGVEDCSLDTAQTASLRIMNAIPTKTVVDLCVKQSTSSDYGEPWFMPKESACGKGVAYTQYTKDLGIAAGTYDFKLVTAGAKCSTAGIEQASVTLAEAASVTLLAYGPTFDKGKLSVLPNHEAEGLNIPLRFVNALNSENTLTAGIVDTTSTPPTFLTTIFNDVPLGGVSAESEGGPTILDDVLADGYTLYGGGENSTDPTLGVAFGDDQELSLFVPLPVSKGHAYSLFALGVSGKVDPRPRLWTCDEDASEGIFLTCGNPVNISFEVFNPNIADAFTSLVVERKTPVSKAIVAEDTDVLCVVELFDPSIKELVKTLSESGESNYEYSRFSDDIPETERGAPPLRQDGQPPEYNPTACPGGLTGQLDTFLQCTITNGCLTAANDGNHYVAEPGDNGTDCISTKCGGAAMDIMVYSDDTIPLGWGVNCYMCGLTHLASYESAEAVTTACTTVSDKPAHMAFGGTTGLAVLSKYPLGTPELVLLPSTGWQRAAMRVPVSLPNGAVVDHWCGSLRFPNKDIGMPYAGQYGLGKSGPEGILNEQQYEIQTLIEAVQSQKSKTGTPALIGLVTYSGPELKDKKGVTLVYGQAPTSYQLLDEVWPRLVAKDYVPACTYCGDEAVNPLNAAGETSSFWSTHLFAEGVTTDQVQSTERTFMDRTVTPYPNDTSVKTPVSQHFGLRSVVTLTQ